MSEKKTMSMADPDVGTVSALPQECTIALFDKNGSVTKIKADRLMELFRESVKIGGRNLIPNSRQVSCGPNSSKFFHKIISDAFVVKAGDVFTASFGAAELTGTQSQNFQVSIVDRAKDATLARFILGPDAKAVTAKVSADCDNAYILIYAGISGDAADKSLKVTELKLERGNIATDWTLAPEDLTENRGGVKSPIAQPVTLHFLSSTVKRKGGWHECGENNGTDRSYIAFASPGYSDREKVAAFGIGFECGHSARLLSDSNLGSDESSCRHTEICNTCGASRILSDAHAYPDTKPLPSHSFANKQRIRHVDKVDKVHRRISLTPRKEVVAA